MTIWTIASSLSTSTATNVPREIVAVLGNNKLAIVLKATK